MAGKYVYVKAPKRNDISQTDRGHWAEKKKNEALAFYVANGSIVETSKAVQVPVSTLNKWKASEWWKDRILAIQNEEYDKLDVKLSKALDKALDQVMDRIEHGDHIYDPRTGALRQIPVKLRDVNNAFNSIMTNRQLVRKQPTKIVEQQNTAVQLANLAAQFSAFVSGKKVTEKFQGNHGFTIAFLPIRLNQKLTLTDTTEIFKLIRKYTGHENKNTLVD